jgi:AGZA family xanthine/uracil permease-like MFS transporter
MEAVSKLNFLENLFSMHNRNTNLLQEFRAGTATFLTMSYILLVNPQILAKIGVNPLTIVVGTALSSVVASVAAGVLGCV